MAAGDLTEFRMALARAAEFVVHSGVMSLSHHGNMSARIPGSDTFLMTAGGSFTGLVPEQLALVDLDGGVLMGEMDPTSAEVVRMHAVVYRLRPEVGGVLHTHSPYATVFAVASQPVPLIYEGMARMDMTDGIPVAAYGPRGSEESVSNIAAVLEEHKNIKALLLENHGVLAFAQDPMTAARANLIAEEAALLALHARSLGGATPLSVEKAAATQRRRDEFAGRTDRSPR